MNSFCRLAATGANTLPRPSNYSIVTATGSKRSSADSDLLLCHVGLRQTSRGDFGCMFGCEHSEIGLILIVPSAYLLHPRPPTILCGRADNACTNLLGFLVRYVRTRGIAEISESGKTADFYIASLPHALATHYFLRLTRARRGGSKGGRRESSLLTFGTFLHRKVR